MGAGRVPDDLLARFREAVQASARYEEKGELDVLEEAIVAFEAVLNDPRLLVDRGFAITAIAGSAEARTSRYRALGDPNDLEHAIRLYEWALATAPGYGEVSQTLSANRANALLMRFEQTGSVADLDEGTRVLRRLVEETQGESPSLLTNLANTLITRFQRLGDRADLEDAVEAAKAAVSASATGSPELAGRLTNLGNALSYRYWQSSSPEDLDEAVRAFRNAVAETPPDSPHVARRLGNLGNALVYRFRSAGADADLAAAVALFEQAVELSPPGSPQRPGQLANLASALRLRAARSGEFADLEDAVSAAREAAAGTPDGSPDEVHHARGLGEVLRERYARTGHLEDLEEAIHRFRQAAERSPPESALRGSLLASLSVGLQQRYDQTGAYADLEEALRVAREAHELTPRDSREQPARLGTLAGALLARFDVDGQAEDINEAVRVLEAAERLLSDSPDRAGYAFNLGAALARRFRSSGSLDDLERAADVFRETVQAAPQGSPERLSARVNLGVALYERAMATGDRERLAEAIETARQALADVAADSRTRPTLAATLGLGLDARYARTGDEADLDDAVAAYELAWTAVREVPPGSPVTYVLGRREDAARFAELLVDGYVRRREPGAATRILEVAEASKSRLLTEIVARADMPSPPALAAKDRTRERALLDGLTALDRLELTGAVAPTAGYDEQTARLERLRERRRLVAELEDVWRSVAATPEGAAYVDLRRGAALTREDVAALASELGPETALVSLFLTAERSIAVVLRGGCSEAHLVESTLDRSRRETLARRFVRELPNSAGRDRGETWTEPLRAMLEEAGSLLGGAARVVLVPHGLGHGLPWSVAAERSGWLRDGGGALPLVMLPALALLPQLRRRGTATGDRVLVAGNPTGDLPHAESEARVTADALSATPLLGKEATKAAVMAGMQGARIVHLACHAYFKPEAPLESGVVLADDVLTAREVLEHRLDADLLVLSACETGLAGVLAGDELSGLALAFLQAGARSLLVSLWRVSDPATAALMAEFYAGVARGEDRARALSDAQAELQRTPDFAHPYYWGAFTLMGDWT